MKRNKLQYQTVKPILRSTLERLMGMGDFAPFRLVGGTSLSLRIERAFGLEEGFLMTLQIFYDIAEEKRHLAEQYHPDISKFRPTLFWDTSLNKIDFKEHRRYVINRVFERGTEEEIQEIIRFYGREAILDCVNLNTKSPFDNNIKTNIKKYLGYEA